MTTPPFPAWSGGFAAQTHRLRTTLGRNLHQFELLFSDWIAPWRLAQQDQGEHSRDRLWNLRLTFWTFLWQITQAGASCREAIRQAQSRAHILQPWWFVPLTHTHSTFQEILQVRRRPDERI